MAYEGEIVPRVPGMVETSKRDPELPSCVGAPRLEVSPVTVTESFLWFEGNSW